MTYDAYGTGSGHWSGRRARAVADSGRRGPAEPRPAVVEPIAAHPPASAEAAEVLTLPFLADIVAPLALAALCGTAVAFFSAGRRHTARPGASGRRRRG